MLTATIFINFVVTISQLSYCYHIVVSFHFMEWTQQHSIKWKETTVLDNMRRNRDLLLKGVLHIKMAAEGSHFNRDEGVELRECCLTTIWKSKGRN